MPTCDNACNCHFEALAADGLVIDGSGAPDDPFVASIASQRKLGIHVASTAALPGGLTADDIGTLAHIANTGEMWVWAGATGNALTEGWQFAGAPASAFVSTAGLTVVADATPVVSGGLNLAAGRWMVAANGTVVTDFAAGGTYTGLAELWSPIDSEQLLTCPVDACGSDASQRFDTRHFSFSRQVSSGPGSTAPSGHLRAAVIRFTRDAGSVGINAQSVQGITVTAHRIGTGDVTDLYP